MERCQGLTRKKPMDRGKGFDRTPAAKPWKAGTKPRARLRPISDKRRARQAFYKAEVASIVRRLGRRRFVCECPLTHDCRPPIDVHHIVKRSQGGSDHRNNLVLLCRRAHDLTDAPRVSPTGRLAIAVNGDESFGFWWDRRRLDYGTEIPILPAQVVTYTRAKEDLPCQPARSSSDA